MHAPARGGHGRPREAPANCGTFDAVTDALRQHYRQTLLLAIDGDPVYVLLLVCWAAVLVWVAKHGRALIRADRRDAVLFGVLCVAALALRLAVPAGPLNFTEAGRAMSLWGTDFAASAPHLAWSGLLALLRGLGISPATLFRHAGPAAGSLGVGLLYALARACGLNRSWSFATAAFLLFWPAHVRYSASGEGLVPGSAVWTGVFAAALARDLGPRARVSIVAAGMLLGAQMRSEFALCALVAVALSATRLRSRRAVAGLGSVAVTTLVLTRAAPVRSGGRAIRDVLSAPELRLFWEALQVPDLVPTAIVGAGILGLVAGSLPRTARAGFTMLVAALTVIYPLGAGGEPNPFWGTSRYSLSFVPLLALGAGGLGQRLAGEFRHWPALLAAVWASSAMVTHDAALRSPASMQREFAYLMATAPEILRVRRDVLLLDEPPNHVARGAWQPTQIPAMAMGLAVAPVTLLDRCRNDAVDGSVRAWSAEIPWHDCPALRTTLERGTLVAYVGPFRPQESWDALNRTYRLEPIRTETLDGLPIHAHYDRQCRFALHPARSSVAPCRAQVGWFRVWPREP